MAAGRRASPDPHEVGIRFLNTDIDTALTFLQLAETEFGLGEFERARELITKAGAAANAVQHHIQRLPDGEETPRRHLLTRLQELTMLIQAARERFGT